MDTATDESTRPLCMAFGCLVGTCRIVLIEPQFALMSNALAIKRVAHGGGSSSAPRPANFNADC